MPDYSSRMFQYLNLAAHRTSGDRSDVCIHSGLAPDTNVWSVKSVAVRESFLKVLFRTSKFHVSILKASTKLSKKLSIERSIFPFQGIAI